IPAYNEAETIGEVVKESIGLVDHIIVVDDGSKDDTSGEASRNGAEVIRIDINSGKANALKQGLQRCNGYDVVLLMDADLQHSPSEIPLLIRCIEDGADLCIGSRFLKNETNMPLLNRISNGVARTIVSLLAGQHISDPQSGFRAIKGSRIDELELKAERYAVEHIMILEASKRKFKICEVPISCRYEGERSHINPVKDSLRVVYYLLKFYL
ncbi:MAG: glycosyltransferase family 2 protein, partial [Candidatus Hydrothermarchaeales archaeon]